MSDRLIPILPAGWQLEELRFERRYMFQEGVAMVRVQKAGTTDPFRMDVTVYGFVTWSGYEEDTSSGYKPLLKGLKMAEETLVNPRSHLNEHGVQKLEEAKRQYLADMARRLDIKKLNPAVLSALRERGHTDKDITFMSPREAFEEYCTWHGLINWGDTLWDRAKELMELQPAVVAHQATPAVPPTPARGLTPGELAEMQGFGQPGGGSQKVVVMMSGGVVEDILVNGKGISVAVVEYDKNADLERQILVPDGDGEECGALASIRQIEVNPGRVEELFSAVEEARPAEKNTLNCRA